MPVQLIGGEPVLYSIIPDAPQHIEALTPTQLEWAAHDLRNAGLVLKHAGHFQGALVDRNSGAVCTVGAIDLATYKRLVHLVPDVWGTFVMGDHADSGMYRASNAVVVLADFLPDDLCEYCSTPLCHCGKCDKKVRQMEPFEKVTHWNDRHAVTSELAMRILGLAADAAMRRASDKRSLLAGRLLAAV